MWLPRLSSVVDWDGDVVAHVGFLAFEWYRGNSNSKCCTIRWLLLSVTYRSIRENGRLNWLIRKVKYGRVFLAVLTEIFLSLGPRGHTELTFKHKIQISYSYNCQSWVWEYKTYQDIYFVTPVVTHYKMHMVHIRLGSSSTNNETLESLSAHTYGLIIIPYNRLTKVEKGQACYM